jgi:signal transduction histidine kinase
MLAPTPFLAIPSEIWLVALAGLISILSCYTALNLIARAGQPGNTSSDPWLAAAAASCGCGIWTAQLVALLGFRPGMPVAYDVPWALLAAGIGIVCSGLGFALVVRRDMVLGGAIVGAAISAMNYTSMDAMRLPAREHWDGVYVAMSFLFTTGLGAVSLPLSQKMPDWRGQLSAALLLTLGTLTTHFTSIAALGLRADPAVRIPFETINAIWFSVAIIAICILIVGLGVIGSLVDHHIAELRATKRELQLSNERLTAAAEAVAAADRAKSRFLASMSHELRTPLNAILGFSTILKEQNWRPLDSGRIRDYAIFIFDSGEHLLALINDILDMSKIEAGHLELHDEVLDPGNLVSSCVGLVQLQAEKAGVRLEVTIPQDLPSLRADDRRLRQILLNLLSNAIKFTPERGRVHVGVQMRPEGLAIEVLDTGIGMTPEEIPTALEYFGQIDSKHSRKSAGTGLGLPLSMQLVELHGGVMKIVSEAGAGTTVNVILPKERVVSEREAA